MKKLLALLALAFSTMAPATTLVRANGSYLVGQPCTLADGTRFICPAVTLTDSSGNAASSTTPIPTNGVPGTVVGGSTTRPADTTAYATGDLVANSTTAGSVVPIPITAARITGGSGTILRVRLSTSHTSLAGTDVFRVHLFKLTPTVANGDNGAYSVNGVAAIEIGYSDVTLNRIYTDGAKGVGTPATGNAMIYDTAVASQLIYGLIEVRNAYTPISGEVFTLALEEWPD